MKKTLDIILFSIQCLILLSPLILIFAYVVNSVYSTPQAYIGLIIIFIYSYVVVNYVKHISK
jgi:hypothetical protein